MRTVLPRVVQADVRVEDHEVGRIADGLLILVCGMEGDTEDDADRLARKAARLRIFRDAQGRMNRSLLDTGGAALVVSQFTLAADTRRGNRPGFSAAAAPDAGKRLYERFARALADLGVPVDTGDFGADMRVSLVNDGPVTIWLES